MWNVSRYNKQRTIKKTFGIYKVIIIIHWTPQVTLEGSTYSIGEQNGSKGPNLEDDDDDHHYNTHKTVERI
jgi:hypothetical protein